MKKKLLALAIVLSLVAALIVPMAVSAAPLQEHLWFAALISKQLV